MRRVESVCDLDAEVDYCVDFHRFAGDLMPEGLPLKKFHRDEGSPLGFVDLIDRADVWVIQRRRSSRFLPEAVERLRVVGNIVWQEFERDKSAETQVLSLVDDPHTAATELLGDPIMR